MAPPSLKTAAGASEPTEDSTRRAKRKSKLERRARRAKGSDGGPVASGSSTPQSAAAPDGELHIFGASLSQTSSGNPKKAPAERTFAEGDDFIAFAPSDPEEEDGAATAGSKKQDKKGKGKDMRGDDEPLDELIITKIDPGMTSEAKEKSSRAARRERNRENEANGDERYDRRSERESGRKRKYDEYDDGYANKKERVDAASRKSPWVNALELDKCRNVAEMCVLSWIIVVWFVLIIIQDAQRSRIVR